MANREHIQEWDVFLSHASEDKRLIRILAEKLTGLGLHVWYDERAITPGQSIRRSIDEGLARSKVGVVVVSPSFLRKGWAQLELDSLMQLESKGLSRIIPVRHRIALETLLKRAPLLSGRHVASSRWRWTEKDQDLYADDLVERILSGMGSQLPLTPLSRFVKKLDIWWLPGSPERDEIRVHLAHELPAEFTRSLCEAYNGRWANRDLLERGLLNVLAAFAALDPESDTVKLGRSFKAATWRALLQGFSWRPRIWPGARRYDSFSIDVFSDGFVLNLWTGGIPTTLEAVELRSLGIQFEVLSRGLLDCASAFLEIDASEFGEPEVVFDEEEKRWPIMIDFS